MVSIIFIATGILILIIGIFLVVFKSSVNMLAGYKPRKYDDEGLRKFAGWHLVVLGLIFMFLAFLIMILPEHEIPFSMMATPALFAVLIKMVYVGNKRYRNKK